MLQAKETHFCAWETCGDIATRMAGRNCGGGNERMAGKMNELAEWDGE